MTIILQSTVGSTALGLATPESDIDTMAIAMESMDELVSLTKEPFGSKVSTKPDKTTHGLHKYLKLALSGTPTILQMQFTIPDVFTREGTELLRLGDKIVSRQAGPAFLGYMQSQKLRLLGMTGQKRVKRPELEEKHGYDTKYAMHALRLGLQGIELLTTGGMEIPLAPDAHKLLMDVRTGQIPLADYTKLFDRTEQQLRDLLDGPPEKLAVPPEPDRKAVELWLHDTYRKHWAIKP